MKSPMTPRTLEVFYQNSCGNGLLDLIAPEVFYQIVVNLEPKDIRVCMCVSRKWRVSKETPIQTRVTFREGNELKLLKGFVESVADRNNPLSYYYDFGKGRVRVLSKTIYFQKNFPQKYYDSR